MKNLKKSIFMTFLLMLGLRLNAQHTFTNTGANVGVNTTSPTESLEIASGNAKITSGNLFVGNANFTLNAGFYKSYIENGISILGYRPSIKLRSDNFWGWTDIAMARNNGDWNPRSISHDFVLRLGSGVQNKMLFTNSGGGDITFATGAWQNNRIRMSLKSNGFLGIGTENPDNLLTVKGVIHTQEVRVDLNGACAPDYVFENNYELISLNQLKEYINDNKHLPEVPSADEMDKSGVNLKEMTLLLLQKIEELTLYTIEQNEQIEALQREIKNLK